MAVTLAAISFATETEPADPVMPPKWWPRKPVMTSTFPKPIPPQAGDDDASSPKPVTTSSYFGDIVDPNEACCKVVPIYNVFEFLLSQCCCNMDIEPPVCQFIRTSPAGRFSPLSLTKDTFNCLGAYPHGQRCPDLPLDDCDSFDDCKKALHAALQSCKDTGKCSEVKEKSIEKLEKKIKEKFPLLGERSGFERPLLAPPYYE